MSKVAYTEEQIKQILQQVVPALKKRLQETSEALKLKEEEVIRLEHELEAKSLLEDENDTLAQQLMRLKSHFQEKIKHLEGELEKEKASKLEVSHPQPESSKAVGISPEILHREKLQRQALESSLIHLQELLTKAQKERQQTELELSQTKNQAIQMERVIAFTREQLDEIQKGHLALRGEKETLQQELNRLLEKKGDFEQLLNEKNSLEQAFREKERQLAQCERDVGLIKQSLLRGLKEVKELEGRYEEALREKGIALQKFQQSYLHVEKLRGQVQFLQEQLDASQSAKAKNEQDLEKARSQLVLAETQNATLQEKLENLETIQGDAHQELNRLKAQLFEKEGDLLQAQQHLAKKVKEVAQLEDKNEEYRLFVNELQQVQNQTRVKLAELQTASDYQVNFQKKLEDQQQDLTRAHEQQIAKWEEKYFAVYDKWQAAENRLRELEKLEEKQKQLQGLLSSLGTVLNPAAEGVLTVSAMPSPPPPPPAPPFAMQIPAKSTSSLFDRPKTQKVRQTFLE